MKITTQMVKELREATGAGVLDAKKALEAVNGDFDKAVDSLREKERHALPSGLAGKQARA